MMESTRNDRRRGPVPAAGRSGEFRALRMVQYGLLWVSLFCLASFLFHDASPLRYGGGGWGGPYNPGNPGGYPPGEPSIFDMVCGGLMRSYASPVVALLVVTMSLGSLLITSERPAPTASGRGEPHV